MKAISAQYIIALTLGLLLMSISYGLSEIIPDIGWHFLTLIYILILLVQVLFYYLTARQKLGWTSVNFVLNFILWIAELVILEQKFGETDFYHSELSSYYLSVMGALLWITNKVILDYLFGLIDEIESVKSRIDIRIERKTLPATSSRKHTS